MSEFIVFMVEICWFILGLSRAMLGVTSIMVTSSSSSSLEEVGCIDGDPLRLKGKTSFFALLLNCLQTSQVPGVFVHVCKWLLCILMFIHDGRRQFGSKQPGWWTTLTKSVDVLNPSWLIRGLGGIVEMNTWKVSYDIVNWVEWLGRPSDAFCGPDGSQRSIAFL